MSKAHIKWTTEEEKILVDQVTKSATNIREALRKAAPLIGRSFSACEQHWYTVMTKRANASVCFVTIGHKTRNINRKNVSYSTSDNTEKITTSWWKKILNLLLSK